MHVFKNKALEISVVSILFNFSLTLMKLIVGILGNSYALISDAIHSSADVMSSVIVAVGIRMSAKPADKEHPYGHERFECVTAIAVAVILLITGLVLGYSSLSAIAAGDYDAITAPSVLAVVMAIIPVIVKELMYRFEEHMSKKLRSDALHADALHHRADEWISLGVLAGVAGGHFGYAVVDTIAGFVVALLIINAAAEIFYDAICKMIDRSAPLEYVDKLNLFVEGRVPAGMPFTMVTRMFGSSYLTDLTLYVDESNQLKTYTDIADSLNREILYNFNKIKCCNIIFKPL